MRAVSRAGLVGRPRAKRAAWGSLSVHQYPTWAGPRVIEDRPAFGRLPDAGGDESASDTGRRPEAFTKAVIGDAGLVSPVSIRSLGSLAEDHTAGRLHHP
jgi:hypothetical protein